MPSHHSFNLAVVIKKGDKKAQIPLTFIFKMSEKGMAAQG